MRLFLFTLPEKLVYFCSWLLSRLINRGKSHAGKVFGNILCIREDEIGDLCYSLHTFDMLRKQYPAARITLLCKPASLSLVSGSTLVDSITSNWNDLTGDYDLIVDLRGSWRSIWYALSTWPRARVDRGTVRFANKKKGAHPHEVITNLQIMEPVVHPDNRVIQPRIPILREEQRKVEDYLLEHGIGRFAVIHPGARRALRRWDKYAELATYLRREKGLEVIITGDHTEKKDIARLMERIPVKAHSIAGIFSLSALAALVSRAEIFVGNESGPLHIASVTGTPSLGLYGPGEPFVFYPWGYHTDYLHVVLPCNPCDQVHCVHPDNPCIIRIGMAEAVEKVEKLLSQKQ